MRFITRTLPYLGGASYLIGPGFIAPAFAANFSRAHVGVQATAIGPDAATVQYYAPDIPRFNGAARRLLIEGQATNLLLHSQALTPVWVEDGVTHAASATVGPDGVTFPRIITEGGGTTTHRIYQAIANAAGATAAWSVILSAGTRRYVNFSAQVGAAISGVQIDTSLWSLVTFGTIAGTRITALGAGFYRVDVVGSIAATANYNIILTGAASGDFAAGNTTTGGLTIPVWAMYAGVSSQASSYIPTTSAALTRGRDVAPALLSALGIPGQAMTITGVAMIPQNAPASVSAQVILSVDDASDSNRFTLFNAAGGAGLNLGRTTANVGAASLTLGNMVAGAPFRYAVRIVGDGTAEALLEGGSWQSVAGGPTALTTLRLGALVTAGSEMFGEHGRMSATAGALSQSAAAARMAAIPLT